MQKRGLGRRAMQVIFWFGLLLTAAGIPLHLVGLELPGGIMAGVGLVALGINALVSGELVAGAEPKSFSVRGPVVRGQLQAHTGLCDLSVGLCGGDKIAALTYGPLGKPFFEMREGVAYVRLNQPVWGLNLTRWKAELAGNVLWSIDVRSFIGDFTLDLNSLRLEQIAARTFMGRVSVICPARGYTTMTLRTTMGELELNLPPEVGAKITIKRGILGTVSVTNKRLKLTRKDYYTTTDFDSAPAQVEVTIHTGAGDVSVN